MSKSFDNGMICASEQSVIVDSEIKDEFEKLMKEAGCYFLSEDETNKLRDTMFIKEKDGALNSAIVGQSPYKIAGEAGIEVPKDTKVLVLKENGVGIEYPFSKEKLSPVLAYYIVNNSDEGIDLAEKLIEFGGLGHSAVIHSEDKETILKFSERVKAGRIIVNSPSTHGAIGDIYNTNMPSLTLGCGTFGGNSTTANVSSVNLINIKRVADRRVNMQWFKVPEKIYFEAGSIGYLEKMPEITRAFIVTDPSMVSLGYIDKILYHLRNRKEYVHSEIFSDVESDPSFDTINRGVQMMNEFKPDVIIAVGGGSPIDAAKGMWLFYEHPDADVEGLKLKFMDIRKRTYKFPKLGEKAKFVSFPKYEYFIADQKYADLARRMHLKADTNEEGVNSLIEEIKKLNEDLGIEKCFKDAGIEENEFMAKVDMLADRAFEDQCTTANPRLPLVSELKQILIDSYYGN